ncbi:MAG: hypothetical protein RL477_1320 [Pseudomonadota bacterium]
MRLVALGFHSLDLYPDEAQYWSWSRQPAFGYFSKPPMVAWVIGASAAVCGAGEACIKAWVPLVYLAAALFVYGAGRRLYSPAVGFFAAIAFITLPGVSFSAAIASTDPLLIAFWAMGLYALVRLAEGAGAGKAWWAVLGLAIGGGLLSKYAMAFFAAGLLLWLALDREARVRLGLDRAAGRRGLALSLALGGIVYLPNFLWNMRSGFVTFAHTGANANLGGALFHPERLAAFLGAQFAVFGPILFAVLLITAFRVRVWRADWRGRLLAAFVVPMLLAISAIALLSRANANWIAPVYVAGSLWVTTLLLEAGWRRLVQVSLALHLLAAAGFAALTVSRDGPGRHGAISLPRGLDPYRHYDGWREVGAAVSAVRAKFPGVPLVANDRMLLAELLYYVRPMPEDVYSWRPDGRIGDHYNLTRPLPETLGADYLFVTSYDDVRDVLRYFRDFAVVGDIAVPAGEGFVRRVWVIHLRGFFGYKAPRTDLPRNPIETRKGQARK